MKINLLSLLALALLAGCHARGLATKTVMVYESRNALQCETSGIQPAESAARLSIADIEVMETHCGQRTGVAYPAACGMGTPAILVHTIAEADLDAAKQAGFQPVADLVNNENAMGYELIACKEGARPNSQLQ